MDHNDEVISGRRIGILTTPNIKASINRFRRTNTVLLVLLHGIKRSIEFESDQIQLMKKYRSKPLNFRNRTKKLMDKLTAEIGFGNSKKVCSGNEEGTRTMQTCQRRKRESKTRKCNVEVRNLLVGFVRVIPTSPELTLSTPLCFS